MKANQRDETKTRQEWIKMKVRSHTEAASETGSTYKKQQKNGQQSSNSGSDNQHTQVYTRTDLRFTWQKMGEANFSSHCISIIHKGIVEPHQRQHFNNTVVIKLPYLGNSCPFLIWKMPNFPLHVCRINPRGLFLQSAEPFSSQQRWLLSRAWHII